MRPTMILASAMAALTITSAADAQRPRSTPISVNRGMAFVYSAAEGGWMPASNL